MNLNWIKVVFYNIIVLLFGVFIIEIMFGNWFDDNNLNKLNLIKDRKLVYNQNLYNGNSIVEYTRDKYGLRGDYDDIGDIEILTMGGSTTDQRYITDGETWQDILSNQFKSAEKNIDVVNAGIDGQSTFGHIKNFQYWFNNIDGLKVDYILMFVGVNDFYNEGNTGFDDLTGEQKSFSRYLKENSAVWHTLRVVKGIIWANFVVNVGHRKINFDDFKWTSEPLIKNKSEYLDVTKERLKAYEKRLEQLFSEIKTFGSKPILVTQNHRRYYTDKEGKVIGLLEDRVYDGVNYNGVDMYFMMKLFNKKAMEACEANNGICINLADRLLLNNDDYYDWVHNNPKGAKKIGNFLYDELNGQLELDFTE